MMAKMTISDSGEFGGAGDGASVAAAADDNACQQ